MQGSIQGFLDWCHVLCPADRVSSPQVPVGVVALILPWNFPLQILCWKLAPALACGNAVVVKPAETTPLATLLFAELVTEAGFPPGTVNVVNGMGPVVGHALAAHHGVDKVAFTGSTATAGHIMHASAESNCKPVCHGDHCRGCAFLLCGVGVRGSEACKCRAIRSPMRCQAEQQSCAQRCSNTFAHWACPLTARGTAVFAAHSTTTPHADGCVGHPLWPQFWGARVALWCWHGTCG